MHLEKLRPYRNHGSIRNEITNLLSEFFGGPIHTGPLAGEWLVPAEITETTEKIFIKAELPGLDSKDIEISTCGSLLTIKGEKKREKNEKDENHLLGERYYGSFTRTFQVPAKVKDAEAEATFKKGVLKISIPKTEDAARKLIEIQN